MNINIIKEKIKSLQGKNVKIKVYLGRNKCEYYEGKIEKLHNNIFTVNINNKIKSFSYSDIVTKNVIITKFN